LKAEDKKKTYVENRLKWFKENFKEFSETFAEISYADEGYRDFLGKNKKDKSSQRKKLYKEKKSPLTKKTNRKVELKPKKKNIQEKNGSLMVKAKKEKVRNA
jgi:hypothetical protein